MKNLLHPEINKVKVIGFVVLCALVWLIGSWIAYNYDVAIYAITRPDDIRATMVVRQFVQKEANANFMKELSIK